MKARPHEKKIEKLCKYMSDTFHGSELNYPIHEKELLALIRMIRKHKIYLLHQEFIVRTDYSYIINFKNYKIKEGYKQGRLIHWKIELSYYNYKILHIAGIKNVLVGILSREWSNS